MSEPGGQELKFSKNPVIQQEVETTEESILRIDPEINKSTARTISRKQVADHFRIKRLQDEKASFEKEAIRDPLTDLYNLRWFTEEIKRKTAEVRRTSGPLYLIYFDFDDFKNFNTFYHHAGGDEIIKLMKHLSAKSAREDEPIARIGGDEFVQLLNRDLTDDDIKGIVERYRQDISSTSTEVLSNLPIDPKLQSSDAPKVATLSYGVARYQNESPKEFLHKADRAHKHAKSLGKNTGCLAQAVNEHLIYTELK